MDDERRQRFDAQTSEQFEALGRFVQAFEHMVFAIRGGIESRLQQESPDMVYFTRMLFHHPALTAWPLWEMFRAVIYTDVSELRQVVPPDSDEFHRVLGRIGSEVQDLISARNTILHGTPMIGWISSEQEDFTPMRILKWGVSAKGWKEAETPKSAAEILALVARCGDVEKSVRHISTAALLQPNQDRSVHLTIANDSISG